jgi:DNA-binding MarR family transcriptional regulator
VVRETPAGDRRAVRVSITDAGRAAAESAGRVFREVLDDVLGYCDDPESVLDALDRLRSALDSRWAARTTSAATPA